MSKRSSPGHSCSGSDDSLSGMEVEDPGSSTSKKRRLVQFDPVRLPSVSGVNDLDERKTRVQVHKLSEILRHKTNLLLAKDKEIERLRQRQTTDESTSCTISRHWSHLDEQLRLIMLRGSSSEEIEELLKADAAGDANSRQFLDEVVQMDDDQSQNVYDTRVKNSVALMEQVSQKLAKKSEQIEQFSSILKEYMHAPSSSGEKHDAAMKELAETNAALTKENAKLHSELDVMHKELAETRLKYKKIADHNSVLDTRVEELQRELDESKFDMDKAQREANKLDYKLYCLIKDQKTSAAAAADAAKQNGQTHSENNGTNKTVEDLTFEVEVQKDLAASRLQEINELTDKVQKLAAEEQAMRLQISNMPMDKIKSSAEYINLQTYYSVVIDECRRLRDELDQAREARDLIQADMATKVNQMKREEQQSIRKVMTSSEQINRDNLQVRTEYDMLRMEFEQSLSAQGNTESHQQDVKVLLGSMKVQNYQLKTEVTKYKKKWKDGVNMLAKSQKELEAERRRLDKCIVIELGEEENEIASPDPSKEDSSADSEGDSSAADSKRIAELKLKLEAFADANEETREKAEILARERRLKQENDKLVKQIKKLGTMDRKEKIRYFEVEAAKLLGVKDQDIDRLKKEAGTTKAEMEGLMAEMESIGQAMEELQENNGRQLLELKEKEEEKMKMMSERITAIQIQTKLKEEKLILEAQTQALTKQIQIINCEQEATKNALQIAMEKSEVIKQENLKSSKQIENIRKQLTEQGLRSADLNSRNEKLFVQNKEMQQMVVSKTSQHEIDIQRVRRMEEENSILRRRYERAKKSEKLGSTDAVLMEEIKELKGALTCPSCKVNRKDAILTKCFHVFCMTCLKKRYDTRQRKCPKCNAGFGVNDFQRAYIT